jgi:hypothetical protein
VLTSDAEEPPVRRDRTVNDLCTIRCDIDTPWEQLPQIRDSKGKVHRRLNDLQLMMKFEGEPKWALRAGKNMVEQDVNVEYVKP